MSKCFECKKTSKSERIMTKKRFKLPDGITLPDYYYLCNDHRHLEFSFNDIYLERNKKETM